MANKVVKELMTALENAVIPEQASEFDETFQQDDLKTFLFDVYTYFEAPEQLSTLDEEYMRQNFPVMRSSKSEVDLSLNGVFKALDRINVPRSESAASLSSLHSSSKLNSFNQNPFNIDNINRAIEFASLFLDAFDEFMHNVPPEDPYTASDEEQESFPKFC